MARTDYLIEQIMALSPEERAKVDEALVNKIAADVEANQAQYDMVLASDYVTEAKERLQHWNEFYGISSGYPSIDGLTKGFHPAEVTVIAGATSEGKTTLAVNMAARMAAKGERVLFVTLEMSKVQLTTRLLYADPEVESHLANISYQLADELNWQSVDGLILAAKRDLGATIVIIDHLHYFTRELKNVAEDLGRITKEFSKNAQRHNLPIIVISHTRKTEKGQATTINDLRGSSFIGQDADIVLMVARGVDAYRNKIAVTCDKNRNADKENKYGKRTIHLDFDATRLSEPTAFGAGIPAGW